ncbi:ABC transporter permease subunit [Microvirga tunisiensis]|uniref:ABC transporter permease subunit n=2 Tax=Pannonibacter tanglangensis TaxID=2750084 RepID=A0ABW9ZDU8_9HYPH|nr:MULTISPECIES: ABC transporter permease [unclassified Pannonibacter]NBN62853.1 ABC transporter permease subunit [Pannonibacter sp. XCT-34]NBN78427.1 ABC transporter permease subunit [Pannonibacter sp. XCT-53]
MAQFLIRRLISLGLTLLLAALVVFVVLEILPGDPARLMLGLEAREDTVQALREQMGLNRPVVERFLLWIGGLATGDLGVSYTYSVPVADLVAARLPVTLPLAVMALVLALVLALPAGIWAASRRGQAADTGLMALTQVGIAIPNFWFAMLLVFVFAVTLRWVPSGGFPGWEAGVGPALTALMLPAVALALPQAAILTRVMRSALIDTLGEDYVRTARAKGLSQRAALWGHALRNALIPVLTILGLQFAFLITGTIIIENVFYLPGIGRLIFQAITQRDLIVVKSVVVLLVALVILVTFLVEIAYAIADPRLRRRT